MGKCKNIGKVRIGDGKVQLATKSEDPAPLFG